MKLNMKTLLLIVTKSNRKNYDNKTTENKEFIKNTDSRAPHSLTILEGKTHVRFIKRTM